VKINSEDFQLGRFAPEDVVQVARWLQEEGVDLLEVGEGNYESPELMLTGIMLGRLVKDVFEAAPARCGRNRYG
jgi:2,4-dienoyl-CoA reductase-like NADH-dependent reductase (Old Yellow Enzyme family)